jgi:hypothetical protein
LSVTALYHRERDIALAAYDGDAAAEAILELASSIHGALAETLEFLNSEAQLLFEYGRDRGSNVHLVASIALRRSLAEEQSTNGNGLALANLGLALWTLGDREAASEKLEEAVRVYQASLEKLTWEGAPLEWVTTQSNLAYAFLRSESVRAAPVGSKRRSWPIEWLWMKGSASAFRWPGR